VEARNELTIETHDAREWELRDEELDRTYEPPRLSNPNTCGLCRCNYTSPATQS
jgi:hypothetical protein